MYIFINVLYKVLNTIEFYIIIMKFYKQNGKCFRDGEEIPQSTWYRDKKRAEKKVENSKNSNRAPRSKQNNTLYRSLPDELQIIKYKWDMRYNFKYYNILEKMYRYKEEFHNLLIKNTKRLREYCECTKQEAYTTLKLYNKREV